MKITAKCRNKSAPCDAFVLQQPSYAASLLSCSVYVNPIISLWILNLRGKKKKRWVSSPQYCCYFKLSSSAFSTTALTLQWSLYSRVKYLQFWRWKEIKIAMAKTWVRAHNSVTQGTRSMEKTLSNNWIHDGKCTEWRKMQATAKAIATETPRMKGAIDTEHEIQELVCAERGKHNPRGVLAELDGQWNRAMEEKDLHFQGLSWLNLMDNDPESWRRKISIFRDCPEPAEEPSLGML